MMATGPLSAFVCGLVIAIPLTVTAQAPKPAAAGSGAAQSPPAAQKPAGGQAQPAPPSPGAQKPAKDQEQPAPKPTAPGQAAATANRTDQLIEPPGFAYNPEGRRDPFMSLVRRGAAGAPGASSGALRPSGLAGLGVGEVTLRGTVRSREGFVGILQGADQKTYIVRAGDKLFDGTVRAISQNDMVIVQQVNDPLSLEKQREVRKVLRQIEAN